MNNETLLGSDSIYEPFVNTEQAFAMTSILNAVYRPAETNDVIMLKITFTKDNSRSIRLNDHMIGEKDMTLEKKIILCAAESYGVEASNITPDTNIREELSNQSLKLVVFISNIEEELDVKIDLSEAGKLKTISDFIEKVTELTA